MISFNNKLSKKLTEEKVCEIRLLYKDKSNTIEELAKKFGVTQKTICDITTGKTWKLDRKKFDRCRKLTGKQVQEIRELHKTGKYLQLELAKKYNVDQTLISAIIRNKIWIEK